MLHFLNSIKIDKKTMRFYAECSLCGKRKFGPPVPFLCRGKSLIEKCEKGKANILCQKVFNHVKAAAMQILAVHFNQCRTCLKWVCDDCFDENDSNGACRQCSEKKKKALAKCKNI